MGDVIAFPLHRVAEAGAASPAAAGHFGQTQRGAGGIAPPGTAGRPRRAVVARSDRRVLRAERQRQQRTLAQVAERAGMSVQYLSELERGRKEASSEMLAAACGSLGPVASGNSPGMCAIGQLGLRPPERAGAARRLTACRLPPGRSGRLPPARINFDGADQLPASC